MREIIQKRLQNISDLDERRKLRTILTDVFETMVEYNEEMYRTLENRIYSEIEDTRGNFYIYSSLEHISNVDPISKFLYPMDLNDLHMDEQNMTLLAEQISTEDEVVLAQIFMKCSHLKIQEIIERAELYKGYIQTSFQHCFSFLCSRRRSAHSAPAPASITPTTITAAAVKYFTPFSKMGWYFSP